MMISSILFLGLKEGGKTHVVVFWQPMIQFSSQVHRSWCQTCPMHHLRRNSLPHKEELCRQLENYNECQQSSDCHPQWDETKDEKDRLQSGKSKKEPRKLATKVKWAYKCSQNARNSASLIPSPILYSYPVCFTCDSLKLHQARCNVTSCDHDGGDCLGRNLKMEKSNLGRYGHGDIWSNMLGYTNGVFNNFYGIRNRNAICHAPHLLDRRIMANMALKFAR